MGKDDEVDQGLLSRYVASLSAEEVRELAMDGLRNKYAHGRAVDNAFLGKPGRPRFPLTFKVYAAARMGRALDANEVANERGVG